MSTLPDTDIAIVGGGLSGTLAALVLSRAGHAVTLIDRNETFPPEFRVEKIAGDQVTRFGRLGLLDTLASNGTYFDTVVNARRGRLLDRNSTPHYGVMYHDLVAAMRRELSNSVRFIVGRVTDLSTSANRQTITVAEHGDLTARLVVLASGMSDLLRARLGIEREVLHERQSLTFGFNARFRGDFPYRAFTYYGERASDGIDYLTMFPIGDAIRANLFTFMDHRDPWVKTMRSSPEAALAERLPGLTRLTGGVEIVDKVQNWIMDIAVARNVEQPGVVLIGDAYQTSCPAAGTGVSRLTSDIERLCLTHIPQWLATPGMGADKIAAFYADPQKQAMDAHAIALANFRRNLTIDTRLSWQARRAAQFVRRGIVGRLRGVTRPALGTAAA